MSRTEIPDHVPADDHDLLVDLARGLLPEAERTALLERIAADPELEEALRVQTLAVERARIAGAPALSDGARSESIRGRIRHAIFHPRPPALIGFGLAVMIAAFLLNTPDTPESLVPALPTTLEAMRLRSGESLPPELTEGIRAYGNGDLAAAIETLESAPTEGVADLVRRAYLGSALAQSERWELALEVLDPIADRPLPAPWGVESRWARAISLRGAGRDAEAREALQELAGEAGPVAARAQRLLATPPTP